MSTQISQAILPILIDYTSKPWLKAGILFAGVGSLALLSQVVIPLPWTPVPITGQTFGVALLALSAGRRMATAMVGVYLGLGWLGLPIFAGGGAGFQPGPTFGYLIGMWIAAAVVGTLADRGWTRRFTTALLAAYMGSAVIFACGLYGLSFFVPGDLKILLAAGLYPFLIGDLIKNLLAAGVASSCRRRF